MTTEQAFEQQFIAQAIETQKKIYENCEQWHDGIVPSLREQKLKGMWIYIASETEYGVIVRFINMRTSQKWEKKYRKF